MRLPDELASRPIAAPARAPFSWISGPAGFVSPVKAVCVEPSIVVPPARRAGRGESGAIVNHRPLKPGPGGMLKMIVLPGPLFASRIA